MKKLYTLALATAFVGTSFAQMAVSYPKGKTPKNTINKSYSNTIPQTSERGVTSSFHVDYAVLDEALEGSAPAFGWDLRTNFNFTNWQSGDYTFKHAAITLDTLVDGSFINHPFDQLISWRIDSAFFAVSHMNTSNQSNDLHFMIVDKGSNNYLDQGTDAILWDTIITSSTSLVDSSTWLQFGVFSFETNLDLLTTQRVALVYEFDGSAGDTSGVIAQYLNDGSCAAFTGNQEKSKVSNFFPNSFVHWGQFDDQFPTETGGDVYYDCNSSSSYEPLDDGESFVQDIAFWARVTIEECDLVTSVTEVDDPGGCTGEATANASGTGPFTYQWDGNTGNQTTATATGLCPGNYSVTITNADNCENVESGIVIEPVGIEEISLSSNVNVFPNPSNGEFNVALNGVEADNYTFTVVNVLGETVLTENVNAAGNYTKAMNLSNLGKGIYMLTVANSKAKSTHKLTIK